MTTSDPTIWSFPSDGQPPDMAWAAEASTLEALTEGSEALHVDAIIAMEAQTEQELEEARALAAQLRRQGIDFDVDRIMKPSLSDRLFDAVEDVKDWLGRKGQPEPEGMPDDLPFALEIPLGTTVPTDRIAIDYDALYAETAAFRAHIAAQISASRGAAKRPALPGAARDALFEMEEWDDTTELLFLIGDLTEYWPPAEGRPALGLTERQEDGGLPIQISLIAHGSAAHDTLTALIREYGGRWE